MCGEYQLCTFILITVFSLNTGCEEDFNETEGDIGLVGYPGPYEDQQNCLYTISILPEHILKLTLTVDIQPSPSCRTEFLKLEHGYFAHNRRLCGFISHISYYIKENVTSTQLRFRTRDLNSVKLNRISGGFEGYYQQFPRSSVSEEEIERVEIGSNTKIYQDRPWWSYHVE